jgi:single-strand DNA-binding protein
MNKIMLIGNVGREPDMQYTPQGQAVAKFSLAVNRRWNDKSTGEKKEETTWLNIVAWGQLAEICTKYVHKGSKLYVEGRLTSRKYTDTNNVERTVYDVIMSDMEMLDPKDASSGSVQSRGASSSSGSTPSTDEYSGDEDFPF